MVKNASRIRSLTMQGMAAVLVISALGCEGGDQVVAPRPSPTPAPTPRPTYQISGHITSNGHAATHTTITATSAGQQWTAQSSFNGSYLFSRLPAGEFQVSTSAAYCGTQTKTVTIPPNATVDFHFALCWRGRDDTRRSER